MAAQIPLVIGTTVPIQQLPAGDTLTAPLNVSGPNVLLGRLTTGEGGHEEIEPTVLTEDTALAGDDAVLGWNAAGGLRKFKVGAFPGGGSLGTGFSSGGGDGEIPEHTVITMNNTKQTTLPGDFDSGVEWNRIMNSNTGAITDRQGAFCWYGGDGSGPRAFFQANGEERFFDFGSVSQGQYSTKVSTANGTLSISASDLDSGAGLELKFVPIGSGAGAFFSDTRTTPNGLEYNADYSATIAANDRSIPDVGTVKILIANQNFPAQLANASAANGQLFYSTTDSKLSYKDPGGTVHNLY